MKILKLLFFLLLLFSCKEKSNQVKINGHVWNKAENTHFAGAKIVLQEYDNAIEANSKTISTALTDNDGNFSLFQCKKIKIIFYFYRFRGKQPIYIKLIRRGINRISGI
ncbi:MAG: hypothetical protein RL265_14 [Bacteroidota bacterium]|jgi:5-hydroxyisourate hydrolase-like protein (transthyretin family)